ncbi:MAG: energy transducer TonB [Hahellaceae bacterium]|nr:energy transducer TonB [Hahellaceae bacterium]
MSRVTGLAIVISCGVHAGLWGAWMYSAAPRMHDAQPGAGTLTVSLARGETLPSTRVAVSTPQLAQALPSRPAVMPVRTAPAPRVPAPNAVKTPLAIAPQPKIERNVPIDPLPSREPLTGTPAHPATPDSGAKTLNPVAQSTLSSTPDVPRYTMGAERTPFPVYPQLARRRGWQGTVVVGLLVSPQGHPIESQVLDSSGFPLLDEAARSTLASWELAPSQRHAHQGEWLHIPVVFNLHKD